MGALAVSAFVGVLDRTIILAGWNFVKPREGALKPFNGKRANTLKFNQDFSYASRIKNN